MKYLIVSDIHGSLPTLQQVLSFYKAQHCDMLCILGDILNYGPRNSLPEGLDPKGIAETLNAMTNEIIAIRGNCDSEVDQMLLDFPILSDYTLLVDEGKRLFLTHGHIYNENCLPKGKFDALFYGHTHLWKLDHNNNMLVCNTGSITFPKGGNVPTFAVYEGNAVSIHRLDGEKLKEERIFP
ncbi:MAG: phosphodiesterase [Bacteroides sp.]|nr:phosphodiesterase [Bacteroides sp.]